MLRIAVLGCGRIGKMHAANVARHPRAELAAVYDVHRPSAETVAATSSEGRIGGSFGRMRDSPSRSNNSAA